MRNIKYNIMILVFFAIHALRIECTQFSDKFRLEESTPLSDWMWHDTWNTDILQRVAWKIKVCGHFSVSPSITNVTKVLSESLCKHSPCLSNIQLATLETDYGIDGMSRGTWEWFLDLYTATWTHNHSVVLNVGAGDTTWSTTREWTREFHLGETTMNKRITQVGGTFIGSDDIATEDSFDLWIFRKNFGIPVNDPRNFTMNLIVR